MNTGNVTDADLSLWKEFSKRHKGNSFLKLNPLYSLPEQLIDIISGRKGGSLIEERGVAPNLWSASEIAFERDLAQTASGGFFFKRPFFSSWLGLPKGKQLPAEPNYQVTSAKQREKIRAELLAASGFHSCEVDAVFEFEREYEKLGNLRAAAYAGWLVMNPEFLAERDVLRRRWGEYIRDRRGFPSFFAEPGRARFPDRSGEDLFITFLGRWGLETLLTWDLPVPIRPVCFFPSFYHPWLMHMAGVELFIPSYVLRDGQFNLKQIAKHRLKLKGMAHLGGWLETVSAPKGKMGDTRLSNALTLYRFQTLAIESRYPARAGWDVTRQDVAFAKFLGLSEESVKRVRLYLRSS